MYNELLFFDPKQFDFYRRLKESEGYDFISITDFINDLNKQPNSDSVFQILDISTLATLEENRIQYFAEHILAKFMQGTVFIADINYINQFRFHLRYCFNEFNEINIDKDIEKSKEQFKAELGGKLKRIVDLDNVELKEFYNSFYKNLYGHDKFKDDFLNLIRNFRVFNKLGEHLILSIFLMGESGVGKTEVARIIHKCLGGNKKLAKINFGNYSSDNSLNSLIGSPRGYIGSEDGEIFIRVKDSDTGLILIDEFEKSNAQLFNYFLDVLENGKMVSSITKEIDLNGYIIIFTSNISKEDFSKKISPELRSRFDYKGYLTVLNTEDKIKFVSYRVQSIIYKYNKCYTNQLTNNIQDEIISKIDVKQYNNMRDLNKKIKDTFVDFVTEFNEQNKN
jgi:ATP-dependent Clp protease ATP-binding subunit ClpA